MARRTSPGGLLEAYATGWTYDAPSPLIALSGQLGEELDGTFGYLVSGVRSVASGAERRWFRRWRRLVPSPWTPVPHESTDTCARYWRKTQRSWAYGRRFHESRRAAQQHARPVVQRPSGAQPLDRALKEGNIVNIDKAEIVATLRSRGLQDRADWVDRELPDIVDTYKNGALLRMLDIDPAMMQAVDVASRHR